MTVGWMSRLEHALASGGVTSQREWIERYPGVHCWFVIDTDRPLSSCACCGVVQRADGANKPCKGIVAIALRSA